MRDQFWNDLTLDELDDREWEALCDGCGRCCLVRFENPHDRSIFYTLASCRLLDPSTCRCRDYDNRFARVSGCLAIRKLDQGNYSWLPETCAYRIRSEGGSLPWWHPLVSGNPDTVIEAGVSVRGRVVSEDHIHPDEIETLILRD